MTTPKVVERPAALEPVTKDPFVNDLNVGPSARIREADPPSRR